MTTTRLLAALAALTLLAGPPALADDAVPPEAAVPTWAPAGEATIHPGVQTVTAGGQCTANFVFHDGTDIYLGQSAHCATTAGSTSTNGCQAGSHPLGTSVQIQGASQPGTLVYSSWLTMQQVGETDADACAYNDFALVRVHPDDHGRVNPTVPYWGGPTALGTSTSPLEKVYSYGNSSLRLGISLLSPKEGYSLGQRAGGWTHDVYTLTPGVPGDSGSAFLGSDGAAIGSLSTLAILPLAGSNGVTDLALALDYLADHSDLDVTLALGTEPFAGGLLP